VIPEGRLVKDWLGSYLQLTSELEAKEILHLWTGLCVIAASTRRRVWLDMEYGRVYPNLYVIIVAESAKARKSTAMDYGRDILMEAVPEVQIMRDSMTSQGLIKAMNKVTKTEDSDGKIVEKKQSDVAIFADEVANLFSYERTRASQMVILLTRTYGCPNLYDHTTVRDSTVRLHNLYPVLLGGTDPRNLKVLPDDAVGGLTGRLIWIIESERRTNNPGWPRDRKSVLLKAAMREMLMHDLYHISRLQGAMHVNDKGKALYDNWYYNLAKRDARDPESDAFYHRCHTTALHIAMLFSLAHDDTLCITEDHIQTAITLVEQQLPEIKRVTVWAGGSQYEQQRAKIILYMQNNAGAGQRQKLLRHAGVQMDEFDRIIMTLIHDGTIEPKPFTIGGQQVYKLTKEGFAKQPKPE